ncbi:response regulator [Chryseolinea sp. T2]|uniref:response regulator n=1 Tax=Chryseolinea sp. T2 TaxID=3129255 RepID=UPI0030784A28
MRRILLAEDDLDDQQIFSEVIQDINRNIELIIVGDGEQVLTALERMENDTNLPDLVILDQNMPRLKGSETIKLIRQEARYGSVATVIYSTYHDSRFIESCKKQGIELFLKPDTYEELKTLIGRMIDTFGRKD